MLKPMVYNKDRVRGSLGKKPSEKISMNLNLGANKKNIDKLVRKRVDQEEGSVVDKDVKVRETDDSRKKFNVIRDKFKSLKREKEGSCEQVSQTDEFMKVNYFSEQNVRILDQSIQVESKLFEKYNYKSDRLDNVETGIIQLPTDTLLS